DNQYNAASDYRGTVYLNTTNVLWNHAGDLVLSNAIHVVCRADDCLPAGPQTGIVRLKSYNSYIPVPLLDLNGRSVAVNGFDISEGGIVTNSAAIATLRIGEGDVSGAVALPALSGGNIALAKRGAETNTVSLASSDLAALRVESGTLVVSGTSADALCAASVEIADGATLVLDGVTLHAGKLSSTGNVERRNGGAIDVAETRFAWFAADAVTDTSTGGVWRAKPPLGGGAYAIVPGTPAVFAATEQRIDFPRVEATIMQEDAWSADLLDGLLADAISRGARARIVAVEVNGAEPPWRGLVGTERGAAWIPLLGGPVATGAVVRVAAEFDFSGPVPLVSYLATEGMAGVSRTQPTRLHDASGAEWFHAPNVAMTPSSSIQGRVEVSGNGELFALTGTAATDNRPPTSPATVFMIQ
ncbi:MAG: hypothetical protein IKH04_11225, partial [Kiritimatiellae bacterium]|nr:hypothetical protein [Kiritimatiellia bacterium]